MLRSSSPQICCNRLYITRPSWERPGFPRPNRIQGHIAKIATHTSDSTDLSPGSGLCIPLARVNNLKFGSIRINGTTYDHVDSSGATIDFLLSAKRDSAAAKRFLAKALGGGNHPAPRVINTDEHGGYPPAIVQLKAKGALVDNCRHHPVKYLNNVLEQDHRAIKRRVRASQHFRSFWGAWRTIAAYEAIHMIRKGQACNSAVGVKVGLLHRFILGLFRCEELNL
jgi:transposase, IS6 family